jgi:L-rhamnonate dehydratase
MRIVDVEAVLLRQPSDIDATAADGSQDALIVRIHTDEGITGIGEVDSMPVVAKAAIEAPRAHRIANGLASLLIGEDPADIGRLWQRMYEGSMYFGRRGAVLHALSGLDIALWDIAGKLAGKPIHALLGGARRDRIQAYASTLMPDTPADAARVVETQLGSGFHALKLGYGPLGRDADLDVALVRAAREAGGDGFDLMIDIGLTWPSAREGIERARRMAEYRPTWIEEPFLPDDHEKYAALARAIDVPLAAGEQESTLPDFERIIDRCGIEVVQPDVTRAGGITETMRIADLVRRRGRRCVLHAWSTGIVKAASLHVLAAMDEAEWFEDCVQETELNQRLVAEQFPVKDGMVAVPTAPGLGISLDEEVLEACRVEVSA